MMSLSTLDIETLHGQDPLDLPPESLYTGDLGLAFKELGISLADVQNSSAIPFSDVKPNIPELTAEQPVTPTREQIGKVETKGERWEKALGLAGAVVFAAGLYVVDKYTDVFVTKSKSDLKDLVAISLPAITSISVASIGLRIRRRHYKKADSMIQERQASIKQIRAQDVQTKIIAPTITPHAAATVAQETAAHETLTRDLPHFSKFREDDVPARRRETREKQQSAIEYCVENGVYNHFEFMSRTIRKILKEEYELAGVDVAERLALFDDVMAKKKQKLFENELLNKQKAEHSLDAIRTSLNGDHEMPTRGGRPFPAWMSKKR